MKADRSCYGCWALGFSTKWIRNRKPERPGLFCVICEFLRQLPRGAVAAKDPTIVNIASVNALAGNENLVAYAGTKGAVAAMTRAMAVEMRESNVRVNSISLERSKHS
jgi:NAD(P)-dependent dehydrogenase (short-subunit alcohol dehydrogenase family)